MYNVYVYDLCSLGFYKIENDMSHHWSEKVKRKDINNIENSHSQPLMLRVIHIIYIYTPMIPAPGSLVTSLW